MSTEHLIRLRGGWVFEFREGTSLAARHISLPTHWPAELLRPFRLVRRFGCPPFDVGRESASLRLENVPGLQSGWLNGQPIVGVIDHSGEIEVPLEARLQPRNELVLEVEPGVRSQATTPDLPWGSIALVIRSS